MEKKKIDLLKGLIDTEIEKVKLDVDGTWEEAMSFLEEDDYDGFLDKITTFVKLSKSVDSWVALKAEILALVEPAPAPEPAYAPTTIEKLVSEINKLAEETTTNNQ